MRTAIFFRDHTARGVPEHRGERHPSDPGTPAPYICGGGAVAVLPIQGPKEMSLAQLATDCRAGGLCDGGAVYVNLTEPAEAD